MCAAAGEMSYAAASPGKARSSKARQYAQYARRRAVAGSSEGERKCRWKVRGGMREANAAGIRQAAKGRARRQVVARRSRHAARAAARSAAAGAYARRQHQSNHPVRFLLNGGMRGGKMQKCRSNSRTRYGTSPRRR